MLRTLLGLRISFLSALGCLAMCPPVFGLERVLTRLPEGEEDGWSAGLTCSISYFNTCTGWVWVWSGWKPGAQMGVTFDTCCQGSSDLNSSAIFTWTGAPAGRGFTGVIEVLAADETGCATGAPLASQVYLTISGWNQYLWKVAVPERFVIRTTHGPGGANPTSYATDSPAAGPTGPEACGFCFPAERPARSFDYGTLSNPLCPGSTLDDGVCTAELFFVAALGCAEPVEKESWSKVKSLYR